MLSYQHSYHAGNFADVLKHCVLVGTINHLIKKEKPLCFIDTHAGRGDYHLAGLAAQKNQEYLSGIGKILAQTDYPLYLSDYVALTRQANQDGQLVRYLGSALLAAKLLRNHDRLFCYDLHPREYQALAASTRGDRRIRAMLADGLKDGLRLLPPKERRGLILIDPSYELKSDYQQVVTALRSFYRRFAAGCYLLWYPVVSRMRNREMEAAIKSSGMADVLLLELGIKPDAPDHGMTASGMIVVNPPWTLKRDMATVLPWLADVLGDAGQGYYRIEELVKE